MGTSFCCTRATSTAGAGVCTLSAALVPEQPDTARMIAIRIPALIVICVLLRTGRRPPWERPAGWGVGESIAEVESDGGLCEVSYFVEVQRVQCEIRSLKDQTAVFGANTEVARDVEVEAAAVDECSLRLPIDSIRQEVIDWIEDQRAAARQSIGSNVRDSYWNVKHERSRDFVHIRPYSRLAERSEIVLRVAGVSVVAFGSSPLVEPIRIPNEQATRLCGAVRR